MATRRVQIAGGKTYEVDDDGKVAYEIQRTGSPVTNDLVETRLSSPVNDRNTLITLGVPGTQYANTKEAEAGGYLDSIGSARARAGLPSQGATGVSAPPATPVLPGSPQGQIGAPQTYTVKGGDTLSAIAQRYGVPVSSITGYRSGNPNLIYPGEVLTVKGNTTAPKRTPGESVEGFTKRIDAGISDPSVAGTVPGTTYSPPIGTSESERIRERAKAVRDALGIGTAPAPLDVFGEADQGRLNIARQERDSITTEMESILSERLKLEEDFRKFKSTAGQGVSEAGRIGGLSEEGRKVQEQLDSLNRRELVLETKLRNRNTVVSELMGLQQQEYADAVQQYNTQFSQAMQMYSIFDKEDDEIKQNAKANLDVLANAYKAQLESGGFTFDQISPIQRAQIAEYEVQAGLPQGSTLAILQTLKPGEEKLYSGVDDYGNFVYITKDTNGQIITKTAKGAVPQIVKSAGSGTTPTPKAVTVLTNTQYSRLRELGIDQSLADSLASEILSGTALDQIRATLRSHGQDPVILDRFDNVVGIAKLLQNKKSSRDL